MLDYAVFAAATIAVLMTLAYFQAPILVWTVAAGLMTASWAAVLQLSPQTNAVLLFLFLFIAPVLVVPALRRRLLSDQVLAIFRRILPDMSQTEKEAIDAGTVWWDADLFSGKPDWNKMLAIPAPKLSAEEQAFLDGPCEEVCAMTNDWEVTHERQDLPPQVWQFLKDKGFFGMIIPKKYGGLGFSALGHSAVVLKLSTRSNALGVSVMVPNSLGPAELLLHYGTDEQKNHYLPRLAKGLEIPCFALTSPEAGSDAASIPDYGVVCKGTYQGKEVLGMRVTWDKRYITLGPIATLLGLAFRLYDPEKLLGDKEDLGITCALVPTNHPGVNIGRRHLPLNAAFQNGPNSGKDVFMPLDWIIGGRDYAGKGWMMLMGCLAAGRSISLPTSSAGGAKALARVTGAYARVRSQFKTPIGKLEGVEEALGRIAANAYMMDAVRVMTAGAVDLGEKPAVVSAIAKYHMTERARACVNDAMDIHGGKGICLGPDNWVGRGYQVMPVGITVEGANILTRTLIIFGQGAIRCHPYVLREMRAAKEMTGAAASIEFDDAFTSHIGHTLSNGVRAFVHGITTSRLGQTPSEGAPETRHYYRFASRLASAFAFLADVSMLAMGGALKRKEKISGRLGDVLSMLYLLSATLKRYEDQGRPREDLPMIRWVVRDLVYRAQEAIDGILSNFPVKSLATLLRFVIFPLGMSFRPPLDSRNRESAKILLEPGAARDRLTEGMYIGRGETDPTGVLEAAFLASIACEPVDEKLRKAVKKGKIVPQAGVDLGLIGKEKQIISGDEYLLWQRKEALRRNVIKVNDFAQDFGRAEIQQKLGREQQTAARAAAYARGANEGEATMAGFAKPIYVVDGARTPFLKAKNRPGVFSAADLATQAGKTLLARQKFSPTELDEVILGCAAPSVDEVNIGRVAALRMGCGQKVPGWTVMRNCASGMQALDSGINAILAGRSNLVLAGGVDALSRAPLLYNDKMVNWFSDLASSRSTGEKLSTFSKIPIKSLLSPVIGIMKGLTDPMVGLLMGQTAENLAHRFGITREQMDSFSVRSHKRVVAAQDAGHLKAGSGELEALYDAKGNTYTLDDGVRRDSSMENLAKLKPFFDRKYGNVTPGNSSQITDGAAWLILASESALKQFNLSPIGMILDSQWAGLDPAQMGLGPVHAATPILQRHGLKLDGVDYWEINEAFAAQVLGCLAAWKDDKYSREQLGLSGAMGELDQEKLNVDGGAVALGHPVGASGARIVLHLIRQLKRKNARRGMASICIGGGLGGAMLVEAA